ncbi:hypothetical protein NUW58_g6844 [Xylaria curta]|uniref:Uncharacterized protein n=1 Tax=Xylaria curta TaxID=42375 RepID=A0ACC1NPS7_9PEZI|nr:hypothetical protein NUW58_g6844 [Xylaria curta]
METLDAIQARHRKEQRDLQSRITSKKKNATKKTRKGVNEECAALERDLKERQGQEIAALNGEGDVEEQEEEGEEEPNGVGQKGDEQSTETRNGIAVDMNGITDRPQKRLHRYKVKGGRNGTARKNAWRGVPPSKKQRPKRRRRRRRA